MYWLQSLNRILQDIQIKFKFKEIVNGYNKKFYTSKVHFYKINNNNNNIYTLVYTKIVIKIKN